MPRPADVARHLRAPLSDSTLNPRTMGVSCRVRSKLKLEAHESLFEALNHHRSDSVWGSISD